MKKKIISVMLVLAMTFAVIVTACHNDTNSNTKEATSATISTESETMDRTDENAFEMEYIGYSKDITVFRDVDTTLYAD